MTKVVYVNPDCGEYIGDLEYMTEKELLCFAEKCNNAEIYTLEEFQESFNNEEISDLGHIFFVKSALRLDAENFPDPNFRKALAKKLKIKEGDEITDEMIWQTTMLNVSAKAITNLKGIEHFPALKKLFCGSNQLTTLDVSKNIAMTRLECYNNLLTSLDVSKNTALKELACGNNQLTSLDVSQNTALKDLNCGRNQLKSLDVSKNTALTYLNCSNNQLTKLDLSKNIKLELLYCDFNQLAKLDLLKNTALKWLSCNGNPLTSLDVPQNTTLLV